MVFAVIVFALTFVYMFLTRRVCVLIYDKEPSLYMIRLAIMINSTLLTIVLLVISFMMMHRLRYRFHGLYTDYGKKLWFILIVQVISIAFSALLLVL